MKPTTEQVLQWVRELGAGELPSRYGRTNYIAMTKNDLEKIGWGFGWGFVWCEGYTARIKKDKYEADK